MIAVPFFFATNLPVVLFNTCNEEVATAFFCTFALNQVVYPHFMYIKHLTEGKSYNKTEKIRYNKFLSHDHQR